MKLNFACNSCGRSQVLASGVRGALPLVGGAWGVTVRKASRNARGVTAGKMERNSSNNNNNQTLLDTVKSGTAAPFTGVYIH